MKDQILPGSDLLARLNKSDRALLAQHATWMMLEEGHVIHEPGADVDYVYFPREDAIAVYLVPMDDGETVECAMVGREGAVGGMISGGHFPAFTRCVVLNGGPFYRIKVSALDQARTKSKDIDAVMHRFADCMAAELFQSIACNSRHSIEQRAARWLCEAMERTGKKTIAMTQEQLGSFLGVGRSYLSRVLGKLREQGILGTQRGSIVVQKPRKLHSLSCDCSDLIAEHCGVIMRST